MQGRKERMSLNWLHGRSLSLSPLRRQPFQQVAHIKLELHLHLQVETSELTIVALLLCKHIQLIFLDVIQSYLLQMTSWNPHVWLQTPNMNQAKRYSSELGTHTVLALYCIAADSSHIWRWQSGGDFVTHGLHPTWGYLAQQNNLWALESWKVTHLKRTHSSVYVQTHLAMININFQAALDKSAPPTAEAVIRERWKSSRATVVCAENKLGSC